MDTIQAFAMGDAHRFDRMRVFDWDMAAKLIKAKKPKCAQAGLKDDWEYTGGIIYEDGKIVKSDYTYLASTWAIPELDLDGFIIPCCKWMDETNWNAETKWPESAVEILTKTEE